MLLDVDGTPPTSNQNGAAAANATPAPELLEQLKYLDQAHDESARDADSNLDLFQAVLPVAMFIAIHQRLLS